MLLCSALPWTTILLARMEQDEDQRQSNVIPMAKVMEKLLTWTAFKLLCGNIRKGSLSDTAKLRNRNEVSLNNKSENTEILFWGLRANLTQMPALSFCRSSRLYLLWNIKFSSNFSVCAFILAQYKLLKLWKLACHYWKMLNKWAKQHTK